ncbi:MAG: sigma-54 dependent transcriptional regulator [Thermoanaerobaculia bacterium]
MNRLLIVEDKESLAEMLREAVVSEGLQADVAANGSVATRWLAEGRRYLAILTDLRLPGADGLAVLRQARESDPDCPVIVMTGYGTVENAVEAMKLGAYDFIQKPIDLDHLSILLHRCSEQRRLRHENLLLKEEFQKLHRLPAIVGESPRIIEVSHAIQRVAPTDASVLLMGESGTGKELFARAIHQLSPRRDRPFVAINCAAIPETLIENELFGHEKGSFTGAVGRQLGKFELADGGTIFLDEIGELSPSVQSKILRVIEDRRIQRIGGSVVLDVDVRIILATNRDLQHAVRNGTFREDLYFRISVFPLVIPPLRARKEDIEPLVDFFLQRFARELGRPRLTMSAAARVAIRQHDWPGNIRELQNCIERGAILCDGDSIEVRDVRFGVIGMPDDALRDALDLTGTLTEATERAARHVERIRITDALRTAPSRTAAAELLGITPRALGAKMKELEIDERELPNV